MPSMDREKIQAKKLASKKNASDATAPIGGCLVVNQPGDASLARHHPAKHWSPIADLLARQW